MYDGTGAQVASLTYDAYGNTVSVTNPNGLYIPFRYRGYYFDEETGFYYLQSRYYDPETGRFINADDVGYLGESNYLNLFAYCGNNPVNKADRTGNAAYWLVSTKFLPVVGHAALLIQGSTGIWWFISFQGRSVSGSGGSGITDLEVKYQRAIINFNRYDDCFEFSVLHITSTHGKYEYYWETINEYTEATYIPGDFSKESLRKALYYHINVPEYSVLGVNCAWLALNILQESTTGDVWQRIQETLYTSSTTNTGLIIATYRTLIPTEVEIATIFGIDIDKDFTIFKHIFD